MSSPVCGWQKGARAAWGMGEGPRVSARPRGQAGWARPACDVAVPCKAAPRQGAHTTHRCVRATGDHLYRMDYRDFVRKHRESGAAITIAALPCAEKEASAFGLMKVREREKEGLTPIARRG